MPMPRSGARLAKSAVERLRNSPVDSFAIDYIIRSRAVPQNEPHEGGVPVMRASIVVSSAFHGSAIALRLR
jgi:hypothetical protein